MKVTANELWRFLLGFACDCAEWMATRRPAGHHLYEAIAAARRWMAGPTEENLSKADAATEAAFAAAFAAARRWAESPTEENRRRADAAVEAAFAAARRWMAGPTAENRAKADAATEAARAADYAAHAHEDAKERK